MLGRMHGSLDAMQPEEQDGFRQGGRIEEHLFPANIWLQNTLAAGAPLGPQPGSFQAYDKTDRNALWSSLRKYGLR